MNILEIRDLNKEYKGFSLKNINLMLPPGYIMGYVGQNGAGKTTTINLINHICKFREGEIKIDGITYEDNPVKYKESIAYVGDEAYFPKGYKVKDVRNTLKSFYPTFDLQKFNRFIKKYNLPENKKIEDFSRGMKVKLMFAGVFSRNAKLLILDEATNGLDPVVRDELLSQLQEYIEDGTRSILFSTHVLSDLEEIADYIVFIDNGQIVLNKAKEEFLEDYLLIKGDYDELTLEQRNKLIGVEKKKFGFEAIISSDDAGCFGQNFTFEKPEISQIMLHSIKNRRAENESA
ncbi:MAG: ABC transporter ATP-binding protein [Eubacterium sp.]